VPAEQPFGPHDLPRRQVDDGLEVQLELPLLERVAQRRLEVEPLTRRFLHPGLEDRVATLAGALRRVHGDVRVAQQLVALLRAVGTDGDADARAERDLDAVQLEGLPERTEDPLAHRDRRGVRLGTRRCGELVSKQAVGPQAIGPGSASVRGPVARRDRLSLTVLKLSRSRKTTAGRGRSGVLRARPAH
jgi:hypothetical protein